MPHAHTALTPMGRLELARLIVDERWPIARAAERFAPTSWEVPPVPRPTAARWADRLVQPRATNAQEGGGLLDRSSRPHPPRLRRGSCPTRTCRA
ncbi:hypothetical protein [Kineococcus sp. SYSU DK005]|uniref:hypothetical protein n=1 Tax=Kineococcus sp. SYSU DK005 TaxID=3383126 RepID=UPI003D7E10CE